MSDEELEAHEAITSSPFGEGTEDTLDRLELFRRELNNSRLEQMYIIKRATKLGSACPYYKKSRRLFEEQQKANIIFQLKQILQELQESFSSTEQELETELK